MFEAIIKQQVVKAERSIADQGGVFKITTQELNAWIKKYTDGATLQIKDKNGNDLSSTAHVEITTNK